jgi:hypothetical protein
MFPFIRKLLAVALLAALIFDKAFSQDLRDYEHTKKFADYLFISKQFSLAAEEYERLLFYKPHDKYAGLKLIQSYRFSSKFELARIRFEQLYADSINHLDQDLAEEYCKNLMLTKKYNQALDFAQTTFKSEPEKKQHYTIASLLMLKDWDLAMDYAIKNPVSPNKKNMDLYLLAFRTKQLKYKKPLLAGLFSGIIPGSGKMYAKDWKDGLISLMFVGVNAWQSYRGFNKNGKESVYGWVFAGIAGSFYLGNIYGSIQSAKKYNNRLDEEIHNQAWRLIVDDF